MESWRVGEKVRTYDKHQDAKVSKTTKVKNIFKVLKPKKDFIFLGALGALVAILVLIFSLCLCVSPLKKFFLVFTFNNIEKTGENYDKGVGYLYHLPGNPGGAA